MAKVLSLALLLLAAGCMADERARIEGVTGEAGDAIAANTVMQMVDPWPRGVDKTNLRVPADQKQYQPAASGGPASPTPASGASAIGND